jgi:hypothetical protein
MTYSSGLAFGGFGFGRRPLGGGIRIFSSEEYAYIATGPMYPMGFSPAALSCFFTVSGNRPRRLLNSAADRPSTSIASISVIIAYFLKISLLLEDFKNKYYSTIEKNVKIFPEMGYFLLTFYPISGIIK